MEKRGSRDKWFFLGVLLLILILLVMFTYVKSCGEDKQCFLNSFQDCKKAKLYISSSNAVFSYEILGKKSDKCATLITLERLDSADQSLKNNMEGKKMVCEIPKNESNVFDVMQTSGYCTGPLKEIFLQVSIEKLYSFIVSSLGPTAVDVSIVENAGIPKSSLF